MICLDMSFIILRYNMQSNQKPIKEVLKSLMTAMSHYDPDFVEMAAKDLCKHILKNDIDLKDPVNKDMAKAITQDYLKQVGSMSFEVHSTAIRCLAEIVPKLANDQLVHIFKSTIGSIVDPATQSKRMQVFSSSASTMINLAPGDLGHQLSTLFVQCVNQFLKLSTKKCTKQDQEVILHLLGLIIDFTEKWPDTVGNKEVKYDRLLLVQVLLRNIETSRKLDLIKKSDMALQKMAAVFDRSNFQFAFDHKQIGILRYVINYQNATDEEQLKKLKNGISSINHIVHAHNAQMKPWAKQIARLCVELVNFHKGNIEQIFQVTEIIQNSIDCLTALLKAYASQLSEWIGTGNYAFLSNFIEETLNFDLENMMKMLDAVNEYEDQYGEEDYYYSEGSFCWKVREVSLSYVTMLMRKDTQFRQKKGKSIQFLNLLSNKLIEQNENVSKKAFECFNYIIESISTTKKKQSHVDHEQEFTLKRVKSNEGNFALTLVDNISSRISILFNHKNTKQESKTQAARTLLNLIQLLNQLIKDNEATCFKILKLLQDLFTKVKPESCVFLIKSSKTLINGSLPYEKIASIVDSYLKLAKSNNFKVAAASFDGLRNVIKYYHNDIVKSGKINEILNNLLPKLKQHDADKIVKVQSIRCLGPIFKNIFVKLPQNIQNQLLTTAETKLKVEIDKTTILSQIPQIPSDYVVKPSQQAYFKGMLDICSESIGTANYELSNLSVECCDKLIRLQTNSISDKNIDVIMNKSRPLLMDGKIPKFLDILIQKFPKSITNYSESITKIADDKYIEKMIEKKIISPDNCINILKSIANSDNSSKLSYILSRVSPSKDKLLSEVNETRWGIISLGALGYVGDLQTVDKIQKIISTNNNHDLKFEGARSIGNIVSRHPEFASRLIQMSKGSQQGYLYLQALKEMLSFSKKQFPNIETIIHFLFGKSEEKDRETNKHLLAECIGNIAKISPKQLTKIIDSVDKMNSDRRYIVASSLRYALETQNKQHESILDETLQNFLLKVMQLTKDKDVNVRQGAFKSLNAVVEQHQEIIRNVIDKHFVESLLDSMTMKDELIKIIDYGVSKEKKDLGKGLRIQAFNFAKSIINFRQIEPFYEQIVNKCLEKINAESSNDLILKRANIIRIIGQKDITAVMPYQNDLALKMGIADGGVLKPYTSSNSSDDERSEGYLKSLLKQIYKISKLSKQGTESIKGMLNKIKTNERLNKLLAAVEAEE